MTFQSSINYDFGFGVPGEIVRDGPLRAHTGYLNSGNAANNVFGRMFTLNGDGKTVGAGGTGALWGILGNPKQQVSMGSASLGPLAPVFALPNNVVADFVEMGKLVVQTATAASPGDLLTYKTADGTIDRVAAQAAFTASQTTNTLTVTAITAGNIGVGSVITAAGAIIGTVTALGTGTGGTGTYILNTSASVGSGAMTANSQAPAGFALIPNAVVEDFPQPNTNNLVLAKIAL